MIPVCPYADEAPEGVETWWNYRLVFHDVDDKHGERGAAVHEVAYQSGAVIGWEPTPAHVSGETVAAAATSLGQINTAFAKPLLVAPARGPSGLPREATAEERGAWARWLLSDHPGMPDPLIEMRAMIDRAREHWAVDVGTALFQLATFAVSLRTALGEISRDEALTALDRQAHAIIETLKTRRPGSGAV